MTPPLPTFPRAPRHTGAALHALFWVSHALFAAAPAIAAGADIAGVLGFKLWRSALACVVTAGLWRAYLPIFRRAGVPALVGALVLGSILAGLVTHALLVGSFMFWDPAQGREIAANGHAAVSMVLPVMVWSAGWWAYELLKQLVERQQELLVARNAATEARLQLLNAQLDPHFLFNTLAGVRALIPEQPDAARELATSLAEYLRGSLRDPDRVWTTVADEIRHVEPLLAIQRVRSPWPIAVAIDVPDALARARVPAFVLQPLVENALAHGRAGDDGVLRIAIAASDGPDGVTLEVRNSGTLDATPKPGHNGVGLANVRRRLAALYAGAASLVLGEERGEVRVAVRFPQPAEG